MIPEWRSGAIGAFTEAPWLSDRILKIQAPRCRNTRYAIKAQNHGPKGRSHAFRPVESPDRTE